MKYFIVACGLFGFSILGLRKLLTRDMVDFQVLFSGASVYANEGNPYLRSAMREAINFLPDMELGMQLTLPGLFLLIRPIAGFSLETATYIWASMNLLAILCSLLLTAKLARIPTGSTIFCVFVTMGLFLGPFHTAIWLGNTDILALAFTVSSIYVLERRDHQLSSGLILGIGMILKIHSAGLFAFYFLARGKITFFIVAMTTWISANLIAAISLSFNSPSWFQTWKTTVESSENDYNKVVSTNLDIGELIHLKAGIFGLFGNAFWSGMAALAICVVLLCLVLLLVFRRSTIQEMPVRRFAEYSAISAIGLLIVYHKFYGAVFLIFPIAWALLLIKERTSAAFGYVTLLALSVSVLNGQVLYTILASKGQLPTFVTKTFIGTGILQFHFVWVQLAVLSIIIFSLYKSSNSHAIQG